MIFIYPNARDSDGTYRGYHTFQDYIRATFMPIVCESLNELMDTYRSVLGKEVYLLVFDSHSRAIIAMGEEIYAQIAHVFYDVMQLIRDHIASNQN